MSEGSRSEIRFGEFRIPAEVDLLYRGAAVVHLEPRAVRLLRYLALRQGRVVSKSDLLDNVWPDAFTTEDVLKKAVSQARRALGDDARDPRFVQTYHRRGYRFLAPVVATPAAAAGEAATEHNLPAPLSPFVGREAETAQVASLLRAGDVRLATLTGPGGAGKTRLALRVAGELLADFPGGVFFVALAPVVERDLVAPAIARAFGATDADGPALDTLARRLGGQAALLVLDNFEQVVGAAPVVSELLARCPGLKALVTSRIALRLTGEHEFPVPPLTLPDLAAVLPRGHAAQCASVALFTRRAVAVSPEFALSDENERAVAEICTRLDGLPLAIELAAARVKVLPPPVMLARLEKRLTLLTGGARDLPARQRTMRDAIAWSHNLLEPGERTLFRRLSVFVGGFTAAAAARVCGDQDEDEALDGVESLVHKSLLGRDATARGTPRFAMLETIREFGLERLAESEDDGPVRERHAAFFLELAEQAEEGLLSEREEEWLARLEQDRDNLRAAVRWSVTAADPTPGLRLAGALWRFCYVHGYYGEGRKWLAPILERGKGAPAALRTRPTVGAGVLAFLQCDYGDAVGLLEEGASLARAAGDRASEALALQALGSVARERGDYAGAVALHERSLATWRAAGDERAAARVMNLLAFSAWLQGDLDQAEAVCTDTLARLRGLGDEEGMAWSLAHLAAAALYRGDYAAARVRGEESLAHAREVGFREAVAWALDLLGRTAQREGRDAEAAGLLRDSLRLHRELGDRWRMASVLEALAGTECRLGHPDRAGLLQGGAQGLREAVGTPRPPCEGPDHERHALAARQALGAEAFAAQLDRGRRLPLDTLLATALGLPGA
jgi:non-specific serine/threonine protein kinase